MPKRIFYTSEYREEAVKLAMSSEQPIAVIANELGVKESTLYNWVSRAMKKKSSSKENIKSVSKKQYQDYDQEIRQLKKELKRAQMERDILKKATAYFASQEL